MNCPECGGQACFHGMDDGGGDYGDLVIQLWRCEECGTVFEPEVPGWYFADWEPSESEVFDHIPPTPRQRIERAVASVCEAAASIRAKLTGGKDELPF